MPTKKNTNNAPFLDFQGVQTGQPITKSRGIYLLIMVAIFAICMILPLDFISPMAAPALALVLSVVWIWITNCMPLATGCMVLVVGGMLLGLFDFGEFSKSFASSPFVPMIGMLIVSMGASRTNFANRVAYLFLSTLGRSPSLILLAISVATAVVSAFVSNLGTTIVMSSISIAIMSEMGEIKGESGLGKAIMLSIPIYSMIGGIMLITGSPSTNMMGISMLESSTNGQYTVTYAQWAIIGIISGILVLLPTWFIYKGCFKVKNKLDNDISIESFKEKLKELGPLRGAELRWIIIVIIMVGTMVTGVFNMPTAALLCGLLTIMPIVGVVNPEDALKSLPFDVLMLIGFSPIIADIINNSNLGQWIVSNFFDWTTGLPAFMFMLIMTFAMAFMINIFANATIGIIAVVIAALTPLVIANGMNPSIILLPAMYMGSATTVLGIQTNVVLTYHHGYWNMKDPLKPGILTAIVWSLILTVVAYIVGPMIGMPLYI
ncbi:MAG: SLC13 family permease [Tepidanaerobacteraceae bacterium]|jgi:sodium-dependent dicarboxylate transporter 2/3/5